MPVFQLRRSHAFLLGSARVSRVGFGVLAETEFSGLDSSPHAKFLAFLQKPLQFHYSTTPSFQDPMELNHILIFTAIATSALVVLQAFQPQSPGARARAAVVLIASVLAWLLARPIAGWLSALAWCALLVVPAFLRNRAWAARYQYRPSGSDRRFGITVSPVVLALIIVNIAVFILELLAGGSTNPMTLHRLGELDTDSVIFRHQYWRLLAALFLHYGPIHIFFNLFALLLLGPALERQIGGFLFAVCYLVSGIGSSIAVVLLTKLRLLEPVQLVGASGCIMGVVGTWIGFLLRHRHAPLARQRLRNIFVIVLLQLAFDIVTPRVSMSAHLGGLFTGFLLGLLVPAKPVPSTPRSRF
jgi:membrane associated rhomboid family serine protease